MSTITQQPDIERVLAMTTSRGWLFVRLFVAAVLLIAAGLKAHQLATTPSLGDGILQARWFNIFVVEFELLFGIWLVFGLLQKLTWLASVGLFAVFATVSTFKGISGEASCGCFGEVAINPWLTAMFDLCVVGMLVWVRPREVFRCENVVEIVSALQKRQVLVMVALWLVMAGPVTVAMLAVETTDMAALGTEFVGADGKATVMLEPEKWVGREFPLWQQVDETIRPLLERGDWTIVIARKDCDLCKQVLEKLTTRQIANLAVLELEDNVQNIKLDKPASVALKGTLKPEPNWVVLTPTVLHCQDGNCVAIEENSI